MHRRQLAFCSWQKFVIILSQLVGVFFREKFVNVFSRGAP